MGIRGNSRGYRWVPGRVRWILSTWLPIMVDRIGVYMTILRVERMVALALMRSACSEAEVKRVLREWGTALYISPGEVRNGQDNSGEAMADVLALSAWPKQKAFDKSS